MNKTLRTPALDSSVELLRLAREGDRGAFDRLLERYLPPFRRWASGRLPRWAHGAMDTEDLVHESVMHLIEHQADFRIDDEGSVLAYLRETLLNRIRDELRRVARRGTPASLPGDLPAVAESPLQSVIEGETLERYETALGRLAPAERQAVVARVELGLSWDEVAYVIGRPSPDAARMIATRAVKKLAQEMSRDGPRRPS